MKSPLFTYDPASSTGIYEPPSELHSIISLFSGAGGLDIGFHKAGFKTIWANEYDKTIAPSFRRYFKETNLDTRSIVEIDSSQIPFADGLIGGPPCQSWSEAGARRGIEDDRGKLFHEYVRVLRDKKPKFFVAENVHGLIHRRNLDAFEKILEMLEGAGYRIHWKLLKASDYGVPQDRERVFIIGIRSDLRSVNYQFPEPIQEKVLLKDAIADLSDLPLDGSALNGHLAVDLGFSPIFMSRNRVRGWNETSYTILASDRHIPIHPQAPKMIPDDAEPGMMMFVPGKESLYRRLTVRECARVQTFPDDYEIVAEHPRTGYKMIGNAVPVTLAYHVAISIRTAFASTAGRSL